jgi:hypothetical protein
MSSLELQIPNLQDRLLWPLRCFASLLQLYDRNSCSLLIQDIQL